MEKPTVSEEVIKEFHKRFADGEQYLMISVLGNIITQDKDYYWQEQLVFNHTKIIVDKYQDLDSDLLYGSNGLVALLVPFQQAYNQIKNKELEYINRIVSGVLCVEDGSIDVDDIDMDGLRPTKTKTIIYRQGSAAPIIKFDAPVTLGFIQSGDNLLNGMYTAAEEFYQAHHKDAHIN